MAEAPQFSCFFVSRDETGTIQNQIRDISESDLPSGNVTIRVNWSSLNFKDALAAEGNPGVAGTLPHVPGIDAAGIVETSEDSRFRPGDQVIVTGYELGAPQWGGWSEFIRVTADWIVPLPANMTLRQAMIYGTAGFTAAHCIRELKTNGVTPDSGPVLVTGASGGVGSFATHMLLKLGYEVNVVTGKPDLAEYFRDIGVSEILNRSDMADTPKRPLLSARWAGGVDCVGGSILAAFLKSTKVGGCVSACGLVAGHDLPITVLPFILRGVKLAGVTSALCPRPQREEVWKQLSNAWSVEIPTDWIEEVSLATLPDAIRRIKSGQVTGRVVVRISD